MRKELKKRGSSLLATQIFVCCCYSVYICNIVEILGRKEGLVHLGGVRLYLVVIYISDKIR